MNIAKIIGQQFARPTGVAGSITTALMNLLNRRQYQCIKQYCQKIKPEHTLDIGFGNGRLLNTLAGSGQGSFRGIEISEDMLRKAEQLNRITRRRNIQLQLGNAADMDFPGDSFDFIYTVNTVYFWPDLEQSYREIQRVLTPGGVFANVFYTREWLDKIAYTKYDFTKYSAEELLSSVKAFGFRKVKMITLQKDCAYCILARK